MPTASGCGSDDPSGSGTGGRRVFRRRSGAQGSARRALWIAVQRLTGAGNGGAPALAPVRRRAELRRCAPRGRRLLRSLRGRLADDWIETAATSRSCRRGAGEGDTVVELSTHGDIQSSKLLRTFADVDRVHVRFDVQYAEDYDNSGGSHGPIIGGTDSPPWGMYGTAGMKPTGSDFFVLNFEPHGVVGDGGELGFYAYFVNMEISVTATTGATNSSPPRLNNRHRAGALHCAEPA